jgi:release factor glutamine methyltransferase
LPEPDAGILLGHVLGAGRAWLIAHAGDPLSLANQSAFAALCARRLQGEPVAYLVGAREFYGLSIKVSPAVLIPRPETELLVDLALERLSASETPETKQVLDLGTGSGCVALAIAANRPGVKVTAAELSAPALAIAQDNAKSLGLSVNWIESDWYAALESWRFDLIVANPPYIESGDPHLALGDLRFEPSTALTSAAAGPKDGLAAIRAIVAGAPAHLLAGGWLLLEHGYDQAARCRELLATAGLEKVQSWRDLAGIERVSGGVLA